MPAFVTRSSSRRPRHGCRHAVAITGQRGQRTQNRSQVNSIDAINSIDGINSMDGINSDANNIDAPRAATCD
jgi:hypothetical protein